MQPSVKSLWRWKRERQRSDIASGVNGSWFTGDLARLAREVSPCIDHRSDALPAKAASESGDDSSRARRAIQDLQDRLSLQSTRTDAEIALEMAQGSQLVKAGWIREQLLVGSAELERAWMRTSEDLRDACVRGDLFSLEIENTCWYPAAFVALEAADVAAVCLSLRGLDSASMFLFWHRKHGSLGGQTLHDALRRGQLHAVLHLARSFIAEHLRGQPG